MAENVNQGTKLPNRQVFKTLVSRANALEADMTSSRGELGAFVKDAEDKHNLHRKAFKLTRQLERMDDTKLAEFLRHFDHYRNLLKLDDKAGIDMFEEADPARQAPDEAAADPDAAQAAANAEALKSGISKH